MSDDNIIRLHNVIDIHIPEIQNRSGSVRLVYGGDIDEESVQIEGSITLSEVCFLQKVFEKWIMERLDD
jgi:hypothetical protein